MSEYEHIIHDAVSAVDRMGRKLRDVEAIVDANRDLRFKIRDVLSEAMGVDPAAHDLGHTVRLAAQRIHDLTAERDSLARAAKAPEPVTWERSSPGEVPPVYPGCWVATKKGHAYPVASSDGKVLTLDDATILFHRSGYAMAGYAPENVYRVGPTRESVQPPKAPEPSDPWDKARPGAVFSTGPLRWRIVARAKSFDGSPVGARRLDEAGDMTGPEVNWHRSHIDAMTFEEAE